MWWAGLPAEHNQCCCSPEAGSALRELALRLPAGRTQAGGPGQPSAAVPAPMHRLLEHWGSQGGEVTQDISRLLLKLSWSYSLNSLRWLPYHCLCSYFLSDPYSEQFSPSPLNFNFIWLKKKIIIIIIIIIWSSNIHFKNSCSLPIYTFNVLLMSKAESDLQLRYLVMQLMMKLSEACVSSAVLFLWKLTGVLLLTSVAAKPA